MENKEQLKQHINDLIAGLNSDLDLDLAFISFNQMESLNIISRLFDFCMDKFYELWNKTQEVIYEKGDHFIDYDAQLEMFAYKILELGANLQNRYKRDMISNQFMRTLLFFYATKHQFNKTMMSLLRYGRDGVIVATNKEHQPININGQAIDPKILVQCLTNLDKKPDKKDNTLPIPKLISANL